MDEEAEELTEDDKELERFFKIQTEDMDHYSLLQLEVRQKLPKMKLTMEIEGSANRVLGWNLIDVNTIPKYTDKVYTMEQAITFKLGIKQPKEKKLQRKMLMEQIDKSGN